MAFSLARPLQAGEPNAEEQYALELLNRARKAPRQTAARLGLADLNQNLPAGTISGDPLAPLAFEPLLIAAARGHSDWMASSAGSFNHTGAGGSQPKDRMATAGYRFQPSWSSAENIAMSVSSTPHAADRFPASVQRLQDGLFLSAGHRHNMLTPELQDIGIGITAAPHQGEPGGLWLTQNFANSAAYGPSLSGVLFNDAVRADGLYDIGEGMGQVQISAFRLGSSQPVARTTSWGSGGYTLRLEPGTYRIAYEQGGRSAERLLSMGRQNSKLDLRQAELLPQVLGDPTVFAAYVDRYPLSLLPAYERQRATGGGLSKAQFGEQHWLSSGQFQGRVLRPAQPGAAVPDYGAYVESYGYSLLEAYRRQASGQSLFSWGQQHYRSQGRAAGRRISSDAAGVDWGALVQLQPQLSAQAQAAGQGAFSWGQTHPDLVKAAAGVVVGTDQAESLRGQFLEGQAGADSLTGLAQVPGVEGYLSGGFGDDRLTAGNLAVARAYGGPGRDLFLVSPGSRLLVRDFRLGADAIAATAGLASRDLQFRPLADGSGTSVLAPGGELLAEVFGLQPQELQWQTTRAAWA